MMILLLGLALLAGCNRHEKGVVAVVNGEKIMETDLLNNIEQYQQGMQQFIKQDVPADKMADLKQSILDQMINARLVLQAALAKGIAVPDSEVNAYLAQMKQHPDFEKTLATMKLNETELKDRVRKEMTVYKFMETQVQRGVDVTDQEIEEFYQAHQDRLKMPSKIRAQHIFVKLDPQAPAADRTAARKKIEAAAEKVRNGDDFGIVALKYSEDPNTAKKGGDLGYFGKGDLLPEFDQAAFTLEPGQVSPAVQSRVGLHLIKITEKKDPVVPPLADIRPQVAQLVQMEKGNREMEKIVAELKQKAKIKVYLAAPEKK
jgi:peptidyl-prolyl cis-trans isomerase C